MIDELTRARQIRDTDPKLLDRGIDGETLFPFCCKYQDSDGIDCEITISAKSWVHAEQRLESLKNTAELQGRVVSSF